MSFIQNARSGLRRISRYRAILLVRAFLTFVVSSGFYTRCLPYQLGPRERPVAKKRRGFQAKHEGGQRIEQNERYVTLIHLTL